MKTNTSRDILNYIRSHQQATVNELTIAFNITRAAVHRQLNKLTLEDKVQKIGKPPKVYYQIKTNIYPIKEFNVNKQIIDFINKNYLYISPTGEANEGWEGFIKWCDKTKQDPLKTADEYISTLKKFNKYKTDGLIDGMPKMKKTFVAVYLDELLYLDFYSIERFGKTKLGQMLLYAKQSQNRILISELIDYIRPEIIKIVKKKNIDGVLFIPPTVKREIQLMKELERKLKLPLRTLKVDKIKTEIIVPQKTLSKLDDRVENAKRTIIVNEDNKHKNILIIDDAVGSGATMNETAKQIGLRNLASDKIIGLAITGSFKGFDVISEV